MSLLDKASLVQIPSGYGEGKLYSAKPTPTFGNELAINGDFTTDSDWTKGGGWSIVNGEAVHTGSGGYIEQGSLVQGTKYRVVIVVTQASGSGFTQIYMGGLTTAMTSPNTYTFDITAQSGDKIKLRGLNDCKVDSISVKEILVEDGDFDFSRSSTGTRVNSDGYIEEVPRNQLNYSEDFSSWGNWRQGAALPVTVTANVAESPTGTLTADRIQCDQVSLGSPNRVGVSQVVTFAPLQRFTISVWAKSASGSDEALQIVARNATGITPGSFTATNEWQKFSRIVEMRPTGVAVDVIIGLFQSQTVTTTDIYLWGAQIVLGETEKPYIKTTDRLDIPRLDYSGGASCPTLLLEPQRTNEVTYSSDYSTGWTKSNTTTIANDIISPSGLEDASKIYPNSSGNFRHIRKLGLSPSSGLYTFSIFAKAGELDHLVLIDYDGGGVGIDFDLTNGVATDNASTPFDNVDMIDYGDGWYRCVATATNMFFYWILSDNGGLSVTANGTDGLYIWGAMAEQGSYATSYIPTSGSTITRTADSFQSVNASNWSSVEGTINLNLQAFEGDNTYRQFSLYGSGNDSLVISYTNTTNQVTSIMKVGGSTVFYMATTLTDASDLNKIAFAYSSGRAKLFINGVQRGTSSASYTTSEGVWTKFCSNIGASYNYYFGKVDGIYISKTALTDEELTTLTTI